MKKIFSFLLLMTTMLLVGGNVWAVTRPANDAASLNDAIAAAETGDIVQLTADVAYPTTTSAPALSIDKQGVEFTLDLNGHNLTGGKASASYGTIKMLHGTMTIISSVDGGSIGEEKVSQYVLSLYSSKCDGKIILESGKIYAKNYAVNLASSSKGTFVMNGGEIVVDGSTATVYGINQDSPNSSIEINGGKISIGVSTNDVAVYGIGCNSGSFTINNDAWMCVQNTGTSSSALTFTTKNGTVVINGGKFVAKGSTTSTSSTFFANTTKIFGGQFDRDVQAWVPTGEPYMCRAAGLGTCFEKQLTHEVVVNPAPVAYIRNVTQGKDYTSISTAFAEAADNDELCVLQDMNLGVGSLTLDKAITFDVNGHTLSASASVLYLTGGADVNHTLVLTDKAAEKGLISGANTIQLKGDYVKVDGINVEGTTSCFNEATKGNYIIQDVVANVPATTYSAKVYAFVASASKTDINNCQFILDAAKISTLGSNFASVFNFGTTAKCTVSINGGTYKVINANEVHTKNNAGGIICGNPQNPFSINDGDFRVEGATDAKKVISTVTTGAYLPNLKIYGGTFNLDPSTWVADGYGSNLADGIYTVVESPVASVNGTEYASLDEAIAAASSSYPVVLLHSTKLATTLDIPAGVTFASTSYTIDLMASTPLKLANVDDMPECIANPNFVATITDGSNATYYFYALDKAVSASGSLTVQLISDITNAAAITIKSGTKTIDFNGHKVTCTADYMFTVSSGVVGGDSVKVNFINSSESESVLECTSDKLQSEGLRVQSKGTPIVVKVGQGVTIKGSYGVSVWKNATLNVDGKIVGKRAFAIAGNGSTGNGGTTININNGAVIESLDNTAIYHPQEGTLNIYGGTITGATALAVKAGTVNISGGTLHATGECGRQSGWSNGVAASGAAIQLESNKSYAAHVNLNITGGTFKSDNCYAFYEYVAENSEHSSTEGILFKGGKFTGNVQISQDMAHSAGDFITGGNYSHDVVAFCKAGYTTEKHLKGSEWDGTYDVVAIKLEDDKNATTTGVMPATTETSQLTIAKDVAIETNEETTEVQKIILGEGADLVVKDGTTLNVGAGGIHIDTEGAPATVTVEAGGTLTVDGLIYNSTTTNFIIEAEDNKPGVLMISPETEVIGEDHPNATIEFVSHSYRNSAADKAFQRFGIPSNTALTSFVSEVGVQTALYKFNYENDEWDYLVPGESFMTTSASAAMLAAMNTSFTYYQMLTNVPSTKGTTLYTMKGSLLGNANQELNVVPGVWNGFANSYSAPVDIATLQATLTEKNIDAAVYVSQKVGDEYQWTPYNEVAAIFGGLYEIAPMQAFLVKANAGAENLNLNYKEMVWDPKMNPGSVDAPRRHVASNMTTIKIVVKANGSQVDQLLLAEDAAFSTEYESGKDALKYMNENVNIYATEAEKQSVLATNNLASTYVGFSSKKGGNYTIEFSNIHGETLYLTDLVTNTRILMVEGAAYSFTANANEDNSTRFLISKAPAVTTDIENAEETVSGAIYNVMGQYVGEAASWNNLEKGVYIINGVKKLK